jgi:enoyl-CoA hydratase
MLMQGNTIHPNKPSQADVHVNIDADGIAWMTLDNPAKLNAMSLSMWKALGESLTKLGNDPTVRCCVLSGSGDKAFCAGADISQMDAMRSAAASNVDYDRITKATLTLLHAFDKPLIAMVSGFCMGAGVALANACDLRVAATGSRFGIPSAKLGIAYYYAGVKRLTELVGPAQAKRILLTGDKFDANEMLRIGLVDELVAPRDLVQRVTALSRNIAKNAPLSLAAAKHAVHVACGESEQRHIAECVARERACVESEDHVEGRRAFMEKRAPVFQGR